MTRIKCYQLTCGSRKYDHPSFLATKLEIQGMLQCMYIYILPPNYAVFMPYLTHINLGGIHQATFPNPDGGLSLLPPEFFVAQMMEIEWGLNEDEMAEDAAPAEHCKKLRMGLELLTLTLTQFDASFIIYQSLFRKLIHVVDCFSSCIVKSINRALSRTWIECICIVSATC